MGAIKTIDMEKIIVNLTFCELNELYQFGNLLYDIRLDIERKGNVKCILKIPKSSIKEDDCHGFLKDCPIKETKLEGAEIISVIPI